MIRVVKTAYDHIIAQRKREIAFWLFLAVDVPEMLWTRHVEGEIVKEITRIVG